MEVEGISSAVIGVSNRGSFMPPTLTFGGQQAHSVHQHVRVV